MGNVVVVIEDISNVLLSGKEPLDPNDVIAYPEFAVAAAKTDSMNIQDTSFSTAQGQLIMPNGNDLFKDRELSCIASKVMCFLLSMINCQGILVFTSALPIIYQRVIDNNRNLFYRNVYLFRRQTSMSNTSNNDSTKGSNN